MSSTKVLEKDEKIYITETLTFALHICTEVTNKSKN